MASCQRRSKIFRALVRTAMQPLPALSEDAVTYVIFSGTSSSCLDCKAAVPGCASCSHDIQQLLAACREYAAAVVTTHGHIWQKEPFNLHSYPGTYDAPIHLQGTTAFGDNVEVRRVVSSVGVCACMLDVIDVITV